MSSIGRSGDPAAAAAAAAGLVGMKGAHVSVEGDVCSTSYQTDDEPYA
jgi:hypothetical protein